ncbi:MAG TPA: hypothetical protein VMV20_01230, partial [Chitinophagaceae bacterium]|nr:hypothetical protein [Chitinophagaceae bacterium]
LVARDPYIIYIHEPPGFHFLSLECPGAERTSNQVQGSLRELTLFSPTGGSVTWRVNYSRDEALKSKP